MFSEYLERVMENVAGDRGVCQKPEAVKLLEKKTIGDACNNFFDKTPKYRQQQQNRLDHIKLRHFT